LVSPHRLLVNARNTHRGPRNGNRTQSKSQKKSAQRRETMFDNPATAETLPARRFPTILVPDSGMHHTKHAATLQWVSLTVFFLLALSFCLHRYVRIGCQCCETVSLPSKRSQIEGGSGRTADAAAYCSPYGKGLFSLSSFLFFCFSYHLHQVVGDPLLKQGLETANTQPTKILSYVAVGSACLDNPAAVAAPSDSHTSLQSLRAPSPVTAPSPAAALSPAAAPSHSHAQTRSLTLGDGQVLVFTEEDVPSPPAVSFADDLPALNRMWDDTSIFWDSRSCLVIKHYPIALVYWKDVYTSKQGRSWKPGQWKGTKGKWFEWKVRYCIDFISWIAKII